MFLLVALLLMVLMSKDWFTQSRDNIGLAMQDVFLFSDTIEGNIAFARPDCSVEEV